VITRRRARCHHFARIAASAAVAVALATTAGAVLAAPGTPLNEISGTAEADLIIGTPGADHITGGAGDDQIDGREGDDQIDGGPGTDSIVSGGGNDLIEARDGEFDTILCSGEGDIVIGADPMDRIRACHGQEVVIGPGELQQRTIAPPRSADPLHLVYDFAPIAQVLFDGQPGLPGLGSVRTSARQFPLGEPFPLDRWIGKVGHNDLKSLSAAKMARLLEDRMSHYRFGPTLPAGLVAIDEVGVDAQDDGFGPRLLEAMRILSRKRHAATGEPLSRRVLMYAAPKFVANVGEPNDREVWDSTIQAARLAGGVYLQMYHADAGRVTSVATAAEWKVYLPHWSQELGASRSRLRVIFTGGVGPGQDVQWRWARATDAGRKALTSGASAYRLGSNAEALAWLRNWNRYAR
jgi:RTX calcium-binding nonapeptide repeat (4 copies)